MNSHKKLIEVYTHNKEGFNPFFIGYKWQVAKLNYQSKNKIGTIDKIEIHNKTDEIFILIKGRAILVGVEKNVDGLNFELVNMKESEVYNVPMGIWHTIVMQEDAEIILVENSYTHINDFEFYKMTDKQKVTLEHEINLLIFEINQ